MSPNQLTATIIWFAIYDLEFEKEEFLQNHKHYRIGFKNKAFNKWVFLRWISYGIWQSCAITYICFFTMDITADNDGLLGSLYVDGQYVYFATVCLVNVKILTSTNN